MRKLAQIKSIFSFIFYSATKCKLYLAYLIITVKPTLKGHSKKTKKWFSRPIKLNAGQRYCRRLKGSNLQYFRPALRCHHSPLKPLFCLLLSGRFRQVLLYLMIISEIQNESTHLQIGWVGHWLDMVYPPPPRRNFVDHIFLKAQCLARILQHVSPLTMAALSCNSLLHTLPYKIFDN